MKTLIKLSTAKWLLSLSLILFTFISCKKDIRNEPLSEVQSNAVSALHENAAVATDWYRLQIRILLERNSAFNTTVYWGYYWYWFIRGSTPGNKRRR